MKECPHCGISVSESDDKCWYCSADLKNRQKTSDSTLQDFLAFPEEVADIIGEYGNLLDEMGREKSGKLLRPISSLPYPKEKIEKALKTGLGVAKDETLRNLLETALVNLEDFIPDDEVPEDPDENLRAWLGRKNWEDPKTRDLLEMALTRLFIKKYGDKAEQKVQEFLEDCKKHSKSQK